MNAFDVAVIGGGAAGMLAAITAARDGASVALIERNEALGRKLGLTGKGRCNLVNDCPINEVLENIPTGARFLQSTLNGFTPHDAMAFFESLGVPLKTERGNRVFPQSDRAPDVVRALRGAVARSGVTIIHGRAYGIISEDGRVAGVRIRDGNSTGGGIRDSIAGGGLRDSSIAGGGSKNIKTGVNRDISAPYDIISKAVILATGGMSYPATGSTGDGYEIARLLGHTITPLRGSLVPLISEPDTCARMQGLTLKNVAIKLFDDGKRPVFEDFGELLFTHFGISGPLALSASAHMRESDTKRYHVLIDLKPALDEKKLDQRLLRDFNKYLNRDYLNSLGELLNRLMIPVIVERSGIPPDTKVHSITREQRHTLIRHIKEFRLDIDGPAPVEEAVITSGGVALGELSPKTMASKLIKGMYFAGEIIDADAYTGGFNLQIAWSTGFAAGRAAAEFTKD